MTHSGVLDGIGDLYEKFFILCRVLASDKDLNGEATTLYLVKIFGCNSVSYDSNNALMVRIPFLAVVRM